MNIPKKALNTIDSLRERYYSSKSGKESLLTMISEAEIGEQVYDSNAIENSTLTLDETEKILLEIDLDRFIKTRELYEAKNLARVVEYVNSKAYYSEIDLPKMLLLHKMLLSNIEDGIAGRFRKAGEYVRVGSHVAASPEDLENLLDTALNTYQSSKSDHIATRVSKFHLEFEHIHPFCDGNGRMGRVLNNYFLIREGFVPINIKYIDRNKYYSALQEYDLNRSTSQMEEIIIKALTNSYHKRLAYLEGKKIVDLKEYSQTKGQSHSAIINKAKRQTIEAFYEKGNWKIALD